MCQETGSLGWFSGFVRGICERENTALLRRQCSTAVNKS